jgi:hypothetical protein
MVRLERKTSGTQGGRKQLWADAIFIELLKTGMFEASMGVPAEVYESERAGQADVPGTILLPVLSGRGCMPYQHAARRWSKSGVVGDEEGGQRGLGAARVGIARGGRERQPPHDEAREGREASSAMRCGFSLSATGRYDVSTIGLVQLLVPKTQVGSPRKRYNVSHLTRRRSFRCLVADPSG